MIRYECKFEVRSTKFEIRGAGQFKFSSFDIRISDFYFMAYRCFNCHKGNKASTRSQHHKGVAGGSWKHKAQKSVKLFKANLKNMRMLVDGTIRRVKLCTDCISKLKKDGHLGSLTKVPVRIAA